MTDPRPQPGILDISTYVPGQSGSGGATKPVKLSSNESPLGPSPKAMAAYRQIAPELELYPDGATVALRQALAATHGLDPDRIICGAGSDELIFLLATAYLGPGTESLMSEHGFAIFKIAALSRGATPVMAPERELTADVDALLSRVTARTRMVFLANPNNPTGTYIAFEEVRRLQRSLPSHVVLVLDGAYAEYVQAGDYKDGIELVSSSRNTVMTRTFSKAYGLAGLRLGWAYCPEGIADVLNRIRPPFNVSAAASAAGVAALNDQVHVAATIAHNERWRPWMAERLTQLGLAVTPSAGNFLLVSFPLGETRNAAAADAFLKAQNIYLRPMGAYGLSHTLRVSIGSEADNGALLAALTQFMSAKGIKP